MKLQNRETGEIGYLQFDSLVGRLRVVNVNNDTVGEYKSITKLYVYWKDYEEPEEHYFISNCGEVINEKGHSLRRDGRIEIGNDFETKEEAEKTVEKFKAWKRLKDKGIFLKLDIFNECVDYGFDQRILEDGEIKEARKDLELLFGGEE